MKQLGSEELLLHIGPHKTGSTALQHALHGSKERIRAQGVHVAGPRTQPMAAALFAATGQHLPTDKEDTGSAKWAQLLEELDGSGADRTVVSSEFFCDADAAHVRSILEELRPERTQVVITLRPLVRILASQWQQFVQNRLTTSYPEWLEAVLTDFTTSMTPVFWRRHRHDLLLQRWAEAAGPDRVTVVVVDEGDPDALLRTFEDLLGVEAGTLVPGDQGSNRSLRYAEVELVRRFNVEWRARGWSESDYHRFVRFGAVRYLQARQPDLHEARILTPAWAVSRAQEVSATVVAAVEESGVEVIGDLDSLTHGLPEAAVGENEPADDVPLEVAARFAAGLSLRFAEIARRNVDPDRPLGELELGARAARARGRVRGEGPGPVSAAADLSTAELLRIVARSGAARFRRVR